MPRRRSSRSTRSSPTCRRSPRRSPSPSRSRTRRCRRSPTASTAPRSEAQTGAEAMSRVAGASTDARATAADVKSLADTLVGRSRKPRRRGAALPRRRAGGLSRVPPRADAACKALANRPIIRDFRRVVPGRRTRCASCASAIASRSTPSIAFSADDGWAIASHIALSALMSLFPFLIVVTALAGFFGSKELADEVARILLEAWPTQVADADRARNPQRADHRPRRRADHRRGAGDLFRVERHREPAHRAQPRLRRDRDAKLVAAAAGIDRLCAGRRGRAAGAGVPDRARRR